MVHKFVYKLNYLSFFLGSKGHIFVSSKFLKHQKLKNMKRKLLPLLLCLLVQILCLSGYGQGWQKRYSPDRVMAITTLYQNPDGTFLTSGFGVVNPNTTRVAKISAEGNVLWAYNYDSLISISFTNRTQDGGFVIMGVGLTDSSIHQRRVIMRIDSAGQKVWLREIHNFLVPPGQGLLGNMDVDTTDDGGFICLLNPYNDVQGHINVLVKRLNGVGDILWEQTYFDSDTDKYGYRIINAKDGGFLVQTTAYHNGPQRLFKIDGSGGFEWEYSGHTSFPIIAADGNILACDNDPFTGISYLTKLSPTGNERWVRQYNLPTALGMVIESSADTLSFLCSKSDTGYQNQINLALMKSDTLGNVLLYRQIPTNNLGTGLRLLASWVKSFTKTIDGGFAFGGWIENNSQTNLDGPVRESAYIIKTDGVGRSYLSTVSGHVFADTDNDCVRAGSEAYIKNDVVVITSATDSFLAVTNDSGYYALGLDTALFQIEARPPSPYWGQQSCNTTQLQVPAFADTSINLGLKALADFPYITMDGQTRQRFCAHNTYYLEYCNTGTAPFYGLVQVEFDSLMHIDSASVPWAAQIGQNVLFVESAGLGVGECRSLNIYYTTTCDAAAMGRTTCINAHAYNDTIINASPLWDQSNLQMSVQYIPAEDSIEFSLQNVGNGGMGNPQDLIVIEDNVILIHEPVQLPVAGQLTVKQKANGATWRATVPQTPYNPYSAFATAYIEAAGGGPISTGFINQFSVNPYYAFDYTTCAPILQAYDPNHKSVLPEGAGPNHLVDSNTVLDYVLEFQNTGTDTAYVVRLVDTLPPYVDPATIRPGVSSHPYRFSFLSNHVIEFLFEAIYLPDSASNQQGSNGFVKFRIKQVPGNTHGTVINNTAAIYFDYNPAIITNTATVTIGKLSFTGIETVGLHAQLQIMAYPNPFKGQATIKLSGEEFSNLQLQVYDLSGRMVKQQYVSNTNQFIVDGNGLVAGSYVFEIKTGGATIGHGKLIAQ